MCQALLAHWDKDIHVFPVHRDSFFGTETDTSDLLEVEVSPIVQRKHAMRGVEVGGIDDHRLAGGDIQPVEDDVVVGAVVEHEAFDA